MADIDKQLRIAKLSDNNYRTWKIEMKWYLKGKGLLDHVLRKVELAALTTDEQRRAHQAQDDKAIAAIGLHIEPNQQVHIEDCTDAHDAWNALEQVHQPKSRVRILQLKKQLYQSKMKEDESMSSYVSRVKIVVKNLNEAGCEVRDDDTAYTLLAGLPNDYENLNMSLANLPDEQFTSSEITKILLTEYDRRKSRCTDSNEDRMEALNLRKGPKQTTYKGTYQTHKPKPLFCSHCRKTGHNIQNCWFKNKTKSQNHNDQRKESNEGFLVSLNNIDMEDTWILDSGCTHHVCKRRDWFVKFKETRLEPINTAAESNGEKSLTLETEGIGDIIITAFVGNRTQEITLHNVYYVPRIRKNLLSVSQIERRAKEIVFENGKASIYDTSRNRELMCIADRQNDLYVVRAKTIRNQREILESHSVAIQDSKLWHHRFCHINMKTIEKTASRVRGLENTTIRENACEDCYIGKSTKMPCRKIGGRQSKDVCELIHSDICGPMPTKSLGEKQYFATFVDDFSKYVTVVFLKTKDEIKDYIKKYIASAELETGKKVKRFRSDNGKEYCNQDLKTYFEEKGIKHERSNVETPQMNGIAERINRTLLDLTRSMLKSARLPQKFWAEAVATAAYTRNRVIHTSNKDQVPLAIWSGITPSVKHLKAYGALAYAHLPKQGQRKLDDRATPAVLVGYATQTRGYRLWCPKKRDVIVTKHVRFVEDKMGFEWLHRENIDYECDTLAYNDIWSEEEDESQTDAQIAGTKEVTQQRTSTTVDNPTNETVGEENAQPKKKVGRPKKVVRNPYGRKGKPRLQEDQMSNTEEEDRESIELNLMEITEPNTLNEALLSPQAKQWERAMEDEVNSLIQRKTWKTIDSVPADREVIGSRWVFKLKRDCNGNVLRYKARLVAQGFTQQKGVDYHETYAPVASFSIIRLLLAISGIFGWHTRQLDIKCAYLYGKLEEEIFMKLPPSNKCEEERIVKLDKPIYGLKQSGRNWNAELDSFFTEQRFERLRSSNCVYVKGYWTIAVIYVDDIFIFAKESTSIENFVKLISKKYETKDLGEINHALGVKIERNDNSIILSQTPYLESLLRKYNMKDCRGAATPLEPGLKLLKGSLPDQLNDNGITAYRELIGSLMYIALRSRPDILFAVTKLSQFNSCPSEIHWTQAKHILRYLYKTGKYVMRYDTDEKPEIKIFCDADWAGDMDDRHSFTGMVVMIGSNPVQWMSSKQKCISMSTMEAEYIALASAAKEAIWLRMFLSELELYEFFSGISNIYCDNKSAIEFSKSRIENRRTKHIDIAYHVIREEVEKKSVALSYVASNENLADIMTKGLKCVAHKACTKDLKLGTAKVGD